MSYRLVGYDTFEGGTDAWYELGYEAKDWLNIGAYETPPRHDTYPTHRDALAAARARLAYLDRTQGSAGGQMGIQDQVWIVHPDGYRERVTA